jgi:hypothetical protein
MAIFFALKPMLEWQLHVSIAVKTFTPSHYTMTYAANDTIRDDEKQTQALLASQFYTQHNFIFREVEKHKSLKLFLDDSTARYLFKNIHIELKAGFLTKEIGDWNGEEIKQIILNKEQIEGSNTEYIAVSNVKGNGYLFFNDVIPQHMNKVVGETKRVLYWQILSAFVLAIFIVFILKTILSEFKFRPKSVDSTQLNILSISFLVMLFFIHLNSLFGLIPDKNSNENRALAKMEQLSKQNIFQYPNIVTNYTNDHFAFRNRLFYFHSLLKAKLLHVSSLPDNVIIGKQGWMFEADELAQNDYRRLNRFEDKELEDMVRILKERIQWCEDRGIKYYIFIPPNRNRIYNEHFPNRYTVIENYGHNRLDFYKKHLHEKANIHLLDPTDSLLIQKHKHDVYYSTDTHWNIFGAWVGYNYLINQLKVDFPELNPLKYDDFTFVDSFNNRGDLAGMLGLENVYKRLEYGIKLKDTSIHLKFPPVASILMHYDQNETISNTDLKLLMFRDSYSNYLIPFLNLHFKKATYVWSYDFLPQLIESDQPDIVILEVQQRAMIYGLLNQNSFHQ